MKPSLQTQTQYLYKHMFLHIFLPLLQFLWNLYFCVINEYFSHSVSSPNANTCSVLIVSRLIHNSKDFCSFMGKNGNPIQIDYAYINATAIGVYSLPKNPEKEKDGQRHLSNPVFFIHTNSIHSSSPAWPPGPLRYRRR